VVNEPSTVHLCLDVEWSVNVHTPNFAVSRSWNWLGGINVENIPLLMDFSVSVFSYALSILIIKFALNSKNLTLFIDNPAIIILEELIPS
jgi:hypothetical protein